jgi:hypothetical protein
LDFHVHLEYTPLDRIDGRTVVDKVVGAVHWTLLAFLRLRAGMAIEAMSELEKEMA